jgi:hypothetical protein
MGVRGAKLTTARLEMLSGVLPRFVNVTVFRELLPTGCAPKLSDVAERLTGAVPVPVPVRAMVCGLPVALSVMVAEPVRVPTVVGLNQIMIVQLPPASTLVPQLVAWLKSPLATIPARCNGPTPTFERIAVWGLLVVSTG